MMSPALEGKCLDYSPSFAGPKNTLNGKENQIHVTSCNSTIGHFFSVEDVWRRNVRNKSLIPAPAR